MKCLKALLKLTAAVAAVAGIAYLVVKHIDAITEWLKDLCPCKAAQAEELPVEEISFEETMAEEAPVAEETAEEAPAEEAAPIPEGEPVAEESDFEA